MGELSITWRMQFCMITILIFWGIASAIMVFDLASVERKDSLDRLPAHPDWSLRDQSGQDPARAWELSLGNGFVSNLEHTIMLLFSFFGLMRLIDLFALFAREEKAQRWRLFFELCEDLE